MLFDGLILYLRMKKVPLVLPQANRFGEYLRDGGWPGIPFFTVLADTPLLLTFRLVE